MDGAGKSKAWEGGGSFSRSTPPFREIARGRRAGRALSLGAPPSGVLWKGTSRREYLHDEPKKGGFTGAASEVTELFLLSWACKIDVPDCRVTKMYWYVWSDKKCRMLALF